MDGWLDGWMNRGDSWLKPLSVLKKTFANLKLKLFEKFQGIWLVLVHFLAPRCMKMNKKASGLCLYDREISLG